jgi:hypothetical protein
MSHADLAKLWAQYNGMKGTPNQLARIMRTPADALQRMLIARGVVAHVQDQD